MIVNYFQDEHKVPIEELVTRFGTDVAKVTRTLVVLKHNFLFLKHHFLILDLK